MSAVSDVLAPREAARRTRRVGHKGADLLAPGNTPAAFDAALAVGVDMIEFDILSEHTDGTGDLFLAHDYGHMAGAVTLEEGLAHLASLPFASLELDVDLKLPGYELRVLDALRRHGLVERALVSTMETASLAILRAAEPALRLGWSVPKLRKDPMARRLTRPPAIAFALAYRAALPRYTAAAIRAGKADALMAHWRLVTPSLVRHVQAAGGELYVWTVDDRPTIDRLLALGVDGVITNDPRLFLD
jgi:glycerophosphoryl diester phosphodiesterase